MISSIPLILLGGTLGNDQLWQHLALSDSALSDSALSDSPNYIISNLTQHHSIQDLTQEILNNAPEKFALAGFSLGGIIAQELVRQAPERILKLALLDSSTSAFDSEKRQRFEDWQNASDHTFTDVLDTLTSWVHPSNNDATIVVKDMAQKLGVETLRRQASVLLSFPPFDSKHLQEFDKPVLVIHGSNDPVSTKTSNRVMAELFQNAKLITISNCGHFSPLEKPDVVTALMQYWLQE